MRSSVPEHLLAPLMQLSQEQHLWPEKKLMVLLLPLLLLWLSLQAYHYCVWR